MKGGDVYEKAVFTVERPAASSRLSRWSPVFAPSPTARDQADAHRLPPVRCERPYAINGQVVACGYCLPCLLNRRRIWTTRIMLEAGQYTDNAFITLTYEEQQLPVLKLEDGSELATLVPKHVQDFLKRLRKRLAPTKLRFYLAGEYGDESWRPHYHASIFNMPTCARGRTRRRAGSTRSAWDGCCSICELVGTAWGHGDVDLGVLEEASAQYVAGYVTKKLTHSSSGLLRGRHPEFSRMSNRPGIGADAMHEVADVLMRFNLDEAQADVPVSLRFGSRELPLGRYLRRKLRTMVGKDEKTPQSVLDEMAAEMLPLREAAFEASRPFAEVVKEANAGKVAGLKARSQIYKQRRDTL